MGPSVRHRNSTKQFHDISTLTKKIISLPAFQLRHFAGKGLLNSTPCRVPYPTMKISERTQKSVPKNKTAFYRIPCILSSPCSPPQIKRSFFPDSLFAFKNNNNKRVEFSSFTQVPISKLRSRNCKSIYDEYIFGLCLGFVVSPLFSLFLEGRPRWSSK